MYLKAIEANAALRRDARTIRAKIIKNSGIRLIFADQLKISRKIILLPYAIFAFAAGVIKPYIKNISIAGKQLCELIAEIIIVGRRAIK